MHRKLAAFMLAVCLSLSLGGCAPNTEQPERYQAQFLSLFDTLTTVVGYADTEEDFTAQAAAVRDALQVYHELYDIYNTYEGLTNLKVVNDTAALAPVQVDKRIMDLLVEAKEMYAETDGRVNIAMGSVLSVWHDYRDAGINDPESAELPPMELLREAAQHTDLNDLILDEQALTVYFADPGLKLDVGAIAKGYAVERVADELSAAGITSLLLSVGGNVRAIGAKGDEPWSVGIQDPDGEGLLCSVEAIDTSVVTSGVYQRYYTVDGRQYHHIIDPDTLMPSEYYLSVSVVYADSGQADALSTALFNLSLERGRALIESLPDAYAIWVLPDGSIEYSAGFERLAKF
ncbi:FAD:protein FMN transferase [Feifania hominis]|uniref:FAD:protein FMN transferase n=1 Tax=Feifania hominis TaxID=2763660 RepID=A0A926HU23_9FIRM|nr:FAD:protein FMN transferase [Feifania hominis]MBC8535086.1 FAD:protein FMN transferase [Feifania hominis]